MKEEKRDVTRTIKETKTFYIADDGEEFSTAEQCKEYEESARYAYRKRLEKTLTLIDEKRAKLVIDTILDDGRSESNYYSFKPQTEDDLKNFLAYAKSTCGGYLAGDSEYYKKYNHFYVNPGDMKVGETYIFFYRYGEWGGIVSKESLQKAIDKCFDEKLWEPVKENN